MSNEHPALSRHMKTMGQRAPLSAMPLLREFADLKRIHSAGHQGSIAERLFAAAWSRVAASQGVIDIAGTMLFDALAATRLGDLDAATLTTLGVPAADIAGIRETAVHEAAGLAPVFLLPRSTDLATQPAPPFVARLAKQPRAGATCPGRGRLVLEPAENHAEHCAMVALFGVVLAPAWGACPETVFLAGLAHHLHNALMPDSGYAGEMALGPWLAPVIASATADALAELAPEPRARVERARRILTDADTPEGQAFHAADTIDRVLQVEHHLRAAGTTMEFVLRDMELVHAGPVKPFQDSVLQTMGLQTMDVAA